MTDSAYPTNSQFAGLVEAATAAADQEVHWSQNDVTTGGNARQHFVAYGQIDAEHEYDPSHRGECDDLGRSLLQEKSVAKTLKRKRDTSYRVQSPRNSTPPAVHPTSALFRQPSTKAKKHTRPPMSKIYSTLELSPDTFLYLQAAAKSYMLDDAHPERRDTVGQRGRGDTEIVKLRLWNCVKDFLSGMGYGEKYFGEHVLNSEGRPRSIIWPRDTQEIVTRCVPLMRRMVTNERQRKYAVESRKGAADASKVDEEDDLVEIQPPLSTSSGEGEPRVPSNTDDEPEILDLLGTGCAPGRYEAAKWYKTHESRHNLEDMVKLSGLSKKNFRIIIANIYGHCRYFHGKNSAPCDNGCEGETVQRLMSWEQFSQPPAAPANPSQHGVEAVLHELFKLVKAYPSREEEWPGSSISSQTNAHASPGTSLNHSAGSNGSGGRAASARKLQANPPRNAALSATPPTTAAADDTLILHISLVSSGTYSSSNKSNSGSMRRTHPRLSLRAEAVPNLTILHAKVKEHYVASSALSEPTSEGNISPFASGMLFSVMVWLPDGLVRIRDDGEWMVALLSAGMVDWMDGEVRVLVET